MIPYLLSESERVLIDKIAQYTSLWESGKYLTGNKFCELLDGKLRHLCQRTIELGTQIVAGKEGPFKPLGEKRKLRTEINRCHDPVSGRFPPELTSTIFERYKKINDDNHLRRFPVEEDMTFVPYCRKVLILGSVCQAWRYIVWTSPSLWTCSSINLQHDTNDLYIDELEPWLKRSGNLPLCLSV